VALASYAVLCDGIAKSQAEGKAVRFITLTDRAEGDGTVVEFSRSWQRLVQRLKRDGKCGEYARVLEVTPKRGRLHIHALVAEEKPGTGYIKQAELSKDAEAVGFGRVTDIRLVASAGERCPLAGYLTKETVSNEATELARYCTKQTADKLAELGASRVRPVNLSRKWRGEGVGGIREAERELMRVWYGRDEAAGFEVWHESDVAEHMRRLENIKRAAERLRLAA